MEKGRWSRTKEFLDSEDFQELVQQGYVPKYTAFKGRIYEVEIIKHFSFSWEWTQSQIRDAIVLICRINRLLFERRSDFQLTDFHFGNVTFKYSNPIYTDIGSFSHVNKQMIIPHMNGNLRRLNNNEYYIKKVPTSAEEWAELESYLLKFKIVNKADIWDDYSRNPDPVFFEDIYPKTAEEKVIMKWIRRIRDNISDVIMCCRRPI